MRVLPNNYNRKLVVLLVLSVVAFVVIILGLCLVAVPDIDAKNAATGSFSATRAFDDLKMIAKEPHPAGSEANKKVRDYIVKELTDIGYEVDVQKASVTDIRYNGDIHNIIAITNGYKDNDKIILLSAHYDSVAKSPGASDDGAGTATLLESARVLKNTPQLHNKVIFLFTDAEEMGMLGAKAFAKSNPYLLKKILFNVNLDCSGNKGPVMVINTSIGNKRLLKELFHASPNIRAMSFISEYTGRSQASTDFSGVFKLYGIPGIDIGNLDGKNAHHNNIDNFQNIDLRMINHFGLILDDIIHHFGNLDLNENVIVDRNEDLVFFNISKAIILRYSDKWTIFLMILCLMLVLFAVAVSLKRKTVTLIELVKGFTCFIIVNTFAIGVLTAILQLTNELVKDLSTILVSDSWFVFFYLAGCSTLTAIISSILYLLYYRKHGFMSLLLSGIVLWVPVMIYVSVQFKGFSYLFIFPVMATAVSALIHIFGYKVRNFLKIIHGAFLVSFTIFVILFIPVIYAVNLSFAYPIKRSPIMIVLVVAISLLTPYIHLVKQSTIIPLSGDSKKENLRSA